ncbi:hypothetical protein [Vibrio hippocampi]|uniref:Uncharacterized protein n=1 Tax=Vibrio hippocampi TaxID=654686 RepID=A0ABN8DNU4_9VIBR|nr:hypothetical protein [Vibrio hippocampi]CAH0529706.1 hypothetical protein VHP8226_03461 [Vibrio hippocampi]
MKKPYRKGIITAQTIAHLMMFVYLISNSVDIFTTLSCYSLFAVIQYLIVFTYGSSVLMSSVSDLALSVYSLLIPYAVREMVGHRFVVGQSEFIPSAVSEFPLVSGDNIWMWGLCFYFLTRFLGIGYGLCFARMSSQNKAYTKCLTK